MDNTSVSTSEPKGFVTYRPNSVSSSSTEVASEDNRVDLLRPTAKAKTPVPDTQNKGGDNIFPIRAGVTIQFEPNPNVQQQKVVNGTVIEIGDVSIKCELEVANRIIQVEMPKSIFPDETVYGTSISLEMSEDDGFKIPKISLRVPDRAKFAEVRASVREMIADL